jgi:hypothetical protein
MIRPLEDVEKSFVRPNAIEFMQLAAKFTTPSVIPRVLSNFHKLVKVVLQTRIIIDPNSRRNSAPPAVTIPSWITNCEHACRCTIGANNEFVAVSANHNIEFKICRYSRP